MSSYGGDWTTIGPRSRVNAWPFGKLGCLFGFLMTLLPIVACVALGIFIVPVPLVPFVTPGVAASFYVAWSRVWQSEDAAYSTCRGAFVGTNTLMGQVVPIERPIISPFGGRDAVWFDWQLYHSVLGQWHVHDSQATDAPFWLQDSTGRILVWPRGCEVDLPMPVTQPVGTTRGSQLSLVQVYERTGQGPAMGTPNPFGPVQPQEQMGLGKWKAAERVVRAGETVTIRARAIPRSDGRGLELVSDTEAMLITPGLPHDQLDRYQQRLRFWSVALVVLAFAMALFSLDGYLVGLVWGGTQLLILGTVSAARHINRQVRVKEQAGRAWSEIDVVLQRRRELLPNLETVVDAYTDHERELQQMFSAARAMPPSVAGSLPDATAIRAADAVAGAQRAAVTAAVAVAESYPDLKADDVYLDLQRRLADAEETVASARRHYNEAIEVLRTRRREWPGKLFAAFVPVPSWELFVTEGDQERVAPDFDESDFRRAPAVDLRPPLPMPPVGPPSSSGPAEPRPSWPPRPPRPPDPQ